MSRKKKPKRRGNIKAEPQYNPFPPSGLVKQYEPFIPKEVGKYCKQYPALDRFRVLCRAVELALRAEQTYKPELGSFATHCGHRLKELHRLHDEEEDVTSSPVHYAEGELERDRAEERGEEVELEFAGGNGSRLIFDLQWWLPALVSDIVNRISRFADAIPTLLVRRDTPPRHRLAAGIQLGGSDNAPAIHDRISKDLPVVVDQQPVGEVLRGRVRAVIDHDIRRQREADSEAEKQKNGDYSPTFLEVEQNPIDVRFQGAKRPPKYLPKRLPLKSLDAPIPTEDGEASTLHDIVTAPDNDGPGVDQRVEVTRAALEELRPSLSWSELPIANEMLATLEGHRSRSLTDLAAEMGHSKGWVSKLWHGVAGKVAGKIQGRK